MVEVLAAAPVGLMKTLEGMTFVYLLIGTAIGFIFGVLPGVGAVSCLALLLPFSWGMQPHEAMAMFAGVIGAVPFGGSITSILFDVPGGAVNVATCFDGYPLAKKGKGALAIGTAAASSALGAIFGLVVLVLLMPLVRAILMMVGPPEFFIIILSGLLVIPLLTGRNLITGVFSGALGLSLAVMGFDPTSGVLRYNFGTLYLYDGIDLNAMIIGLFAISEAINMIGMGGAVAPIIAKQKFSDVIEGVKTVFRYKATFFRTSVVGTIIGILPGIGGATANLFGWAITAQSSPRKQYFGTGEIEGVIGAETAKSAEPSGALLPTLAFGIPGGAQMAVLLAAFVFHGLSPGPDLMKEHLDITWTIIFGLLFANILASTIGALLAQPMARLTAISGNIIAPIIVVACLIGAFATRNQPLDMLVALIFGFIGYLMMRYEFSRVTLLLGFILGYLAEMSFRQTIAISDVGLLIFVQRPITVSLIILLVLLFVYMLAILPMRRRKTGQAKETE